MCLKKSFLFTEKVSLEELSPRDATAINIPEKKQLEPISVPVANGVETGTSGNPPLPPIRHWIRIELFIYFKRHPQLKWDSIDCVSFSRLVAVGFFFLIIILFIDQEFVSIWFILSNVIIRSNIDLFLTAICEL